MVIARARALCTAFVLHGLGTPLTKAFYVVAPKHAGGPYRTSDLGRHLVGQASRRAMGRHTAAGRVCMSSDTTTEKPAPPSMEEEVDPGVVDGTDLRVLKYPHPALRADNEEISEFNDEVKKLVKDMFKVMYAMKGVGLAAPQVGVNKRLMVFNPEGDEKNWLDEAVLVNPRIVEFGKGKETDEEGCLSFPGMSGPVERAKWVKVEAFNAKGKKVKKKYTDYTARIFQHEYDHLDGKVYIDHLSASNREKVQPVLDKLIADHGEGGVLRGLTVASATGAEVGESFNADELERMSYRELQALAKEYKVRANQKSSDIIRDLTSIARQDGEATGDVIPAAAVDGGAEPRGVAGDPEQEAGLGEGWKPAGEGYAMKVLDEDLLGFDLDGDFREQVDLDGAPARGRERKPPARVTGGGMDMTGLIGGVDQGDGWAKFGLRDGEAADVGDDMPKPFGDEDDGMADEDDVLDEELDFGGIRVVDIGKNGVGEGIGGGSAAAAAASDGDDDDASAIMERRIREALSGKTRLSDAMEKATPEQYGFKRDNLSLEKLSISVPEGHCPGCGAKFQSAIEGQPGFLPPDKLEELRARELELKLKGTPAEEPRDEDIVDAFESFPDLDEEDGDPGIDENARGIIEDVEAWLDAQPGMRNPDLDMDGEENGDAGKDVPRGSLAEGAGGTSEGLGRAQRDAAVLEKLRIRSGGVDRQQSEGVLREGEVAGSEEESEEKLVVCQRCHKLRFYGSVEENLRPGFSDSDLLTPKRFLHLLGSLREKRCLVIYLVDLFDFHGTFLFDLPHIIGRNPILVAGNKVDLLPRDLKPDRVRLWVRDRCRQAGLDEMETRDVHLVSSRQGTGVAPLMRKAREMALRRRCDIFVIGAANVGKSTFINYLIQEKGDNGGGVGRRGGRGGKKQGGRGKPGRGVTVSNIPGTTLDFLKVDLGERKALYDTPGLLLRHTFTSRLNADELRAVIPRKQVEHVTLRMGEGKCVLIGGLARIEVLEGRPFMFTFFVSNDVRLHPTDTRRVDDMLEKHLGKDKMVFPPYETERLGEIGEMVTTDFDIMGAGWKESAADVVIAGLGWVSITGAGPVAVRVWAPRGVLVLARDPLLPYESRETTAKFTGAATVKKGRKKQGRRV